MNKFAKSCLSISFGKSGVFLVRKKTVLNFIQGILRGTFRAVSVLKTK